MTQIAIACPTCTFVYAPPTSCCN